MTKFDVTKDFDEEAHDEFELLFERADKDDFKNDGGFYLGDLESELQYEVDYYCFKDWHAEYKAGKFKSGPRFTCSYPQM